MVSSSSVIRHGEGTVAGEDGGARRPVPALSRQTSRELLTGSVDVGQATRTRDVMAESFTIGANSGAIEVAAEDARRVTAMRRLVRARLTYCGLLGLVDDAELIVSELITNSITHSRGTQVRLLVQLVGGQLRIEVDDGAARSPQSQQIPDDEAECGRGLHLVDWMARSHHGSWGVSADGARTWCNLSIPDEVGRHD